MSRPSPHIGPSWPLLFTLSVALTACVGDRPGDGLRDWAEDRDWGSNISWNDIVEEVDWDDVQDDVQDINWPDWSTSSGSGHDGDDGDDDDDDDSSSGCIYPCTDDGDDGSDSSDGSEDTGTPNDTGSPTSDDGPDDPEGSNSSAPQGELPGSWLVTWMSFDGTQLTMPRTTSFSDGTTITYTDTLAITEGMACRLTFTTVTQPPSGSATTSSSPVMCVVSDLGNNRYRLMTSSYSSLFPLQCTHVGPALNCLSSSGDAYQLTR